jgi:hypothetical protein
MVVAIQSSKITKPPASPAARTIKSQLSLELVRDWATAEIFLGGHWRVNSNPGQHSLARNVVEKRPKCCIVTG